MKTLKEAISALNEEYFEDFDLWRNGDVDYDDARMLAIMQEYKRRYLEICVSDLPR